MIIAGFMQMYNEAERGNLRRCLENLLKYCDIVVIYDDGSTDDSVKVANEYGGVFVLYGKKNDFLNETKHKESLLNWANCLDLDIDWFFWLDCDEILDANGVKNIRSFCETADKDGYYFPELTLWRSECYVRRDYLGYGKFLRLWRNNGKLSFKKTTGLHGQLFPDGLSSVDITPFNIIHYGYATYGAIVERWKERTRHGVPTNIREGCLDESNLILEHLPHELFPEGCEPKNCEKPTPIKYCVHKDAISKYVGGGEDYVHSVTLEWRAGHIYPLLFEENSRWMKGRILYLGCNAGTSTFFLSSYCDELIGADVNARALEKAEELFKKNGINNTKFVHCSVTEMPFEDEYFDGVYAFDIIEHIYEEDFKIMLEEISRIMKKGGYLLVLTPRADLNSTDKFLKQNAFDVHHKIFFDSEEKVRDYLTKTPNFEIIWLEHETRGNPGRLNERHNSWKVLLRKV